MQSACPFLLEPMTACLLDAYSKLLVMLANFVDLFFSLMYMLFCREDALQELADEGIRIAKMDVTSVSNIKEVVDSIMKDQGHIDLLVCNAGEHDQPDRTYFLDIFVKRKDRDLNLCASCCSHHKGANQVKSFCSISYRVTQVGLQQCDYLPDFLCKTAERPRVSMQVLQQAAFLQSRTMTQ